MGYSGPASFDFFADDGFGVSSTVAVTIDVSAAPLMNLDFQRRNLRLQGDRAEHIVVIGDFADQEDVVLDPSYLALQTTTASIATVSTSGWLQTFADGSTILTATRGRVVAATAVTVGVPTSGLPQRLYNDGLDSYPLAVSLSSEGGERQFKIHPLGDIDLETYLSPAATGTRYFVNRPDVVAITPDGLMTAIAAGTVTVTVINGPAESVIPVLVEAPRTGVVTLDESGGVVRGADGSLVAVPPGVLNQDTPISLERQTQADLPMALIDGTGFAAAFRLDLGEETLSVPVQLAVPVASDAPVGATVYFYRAGKTLDDQGAEVPIWWQVESGVIGPDHVAHDVTTEHRDHEWWTIPDCLPERI